MKRDIGWWYTLIWLIIGGLANLFAFLDGIDSETAFWAVVIVIPSIIWLLNKSK